MPFLSGTPPFKPLRPVFAIVLGNTLLSTVPGVSGAGMSPEKTVLTPILDSELITYGAIRSRKWKPNTPTGCPTPAVITRAMMVLLGMQPLFINAGLTTQPVIPCLDVYGEPGKDPREGDAVPRSRELYTRGEQIGRFLSQSADFLLLGECVPGGTTTALCVLRGLGIPASVSSSFVNNPVGAEGGDLRPGTGTNPGRGREGDPEGEGDPARRRTPSTSSVSAATRCSRWPRAWHPGSKGIPFSRAEHRCLP